MGSPGPGTLWLRQWLDRGKPRADLAIARLCQYVPVLFTYKLWPVLCYTMGEMNSGDTDYVTFVLKMFTVWFLKQAPADFWALTESAHVAIRNRPCSQACGLSVHPRVLFTCPWLLTSTSFKRRGQKPPWSSLFNKQAS